jgi:hypothetical protein
MLIELAGLHVLHEPLRLYEEATDFEKRTWRSVFAAAFVKEVDSRLGLSEENTISNVRDIAAGVASNYADHAVLGLREYREQVEE